MKAILSLVLQGTDSLAQQRNDSPAGGAKEGAVLATLQLVRTALEKDAEVVQALKATQQNGESGSCSQRCKSWLRQSIPIRLVGTLGWQEHLLRSDIVKLSCLAIGCIPHKPSLLQGLPCSLRCSYTAWFRTENLVWNGENSNLSIQSPELHSRWLTLQCSARPWRLCSIEITGGYLSSWGMCATLTISGFKRRPSGLPSS